MIPTLIVPILNRPDLLDRMLDSIDHPVEQIIIIDNGDVVPGLWPPRSFPLELPNGTGEGRIIRLPHNIGVAASWNLGIKVTPKAPWWLIVNNDLTFSPGDLAKIEGAVDPTAPMILLAPNYSCFAITPSAIERIGFFDENLHPGYFEDNDTAQRARYADVPIVEIATGVQHIGSSTIYSDPTYREANNRTFPLNESYYVRKWGGSVGHEKFDTPFNAGGDIKPGQPDLARLRNQAWQRSK